MDCSTRRTGPPRQIHMRQRYYELVADCNKQQEGAEHNHGPRRISDISRAAVSLSSTLVCSKIVAECCSLCVRQELAGFMEHLEISQMMKSPKKIGDKNRHASVQQNPRVRRPLSSPRRRKQTFKQFASYRLHQLTTLSERFIGMRYRRKFGLRVVEVGILILVGGSGPLSFKTTYTKANLEKSNASRLAAQLLEKGLLEKREDPADQRSFYLALTPAGQKLYRELYADALGRNERWMAVLPKKQRAVFLSCLEMLTQNMRKLLQEEMNATGPVGALEDRARRDVEDLETPQRIVLDSAFASRLHGLLGAALGKKLDT
jgi:DNA-binding MarR family transcriptional regulator